MKWAIAVYLVASVCSVLSTEPNDGKPYLNVMARSSVYNAGEKKAIYCQGRNIPQQIQWYSPSGAVVEGRSTKNTRVFVETPKNDTLANSLVPLIIQSTQIKDSGNWTCKAGDMSESIEILVGEKVKIPVRNENFEGEEGKSARLNCVAKGNPPPVVQWYKDMVPIPVDRKKYVLNKKEDNHQLEIKNLNHMDAGEYACKVTQEALSHYTDKVVRLTVQHKPLIVNTLTQEVLYTTKFKTQEVYAILNETKNITCGAIANPPPTYIWYRRRNSYDDDPISGEDSVFTSEDGTYSILMLRMYDESYLGEYVCSANNSKGHVSIVFHVTLGNKPNPPDNVVFIGANTTYFTFNVSCSNCTMVEEEGVAPQPDNLKILGYSFEFVPVQKEYNTPDWDMAVEYRVDIQSPDDTVFTVGPLQNSTEYYGRVRTWNAAGYSEWVPISPNPVTTDNAVKVLSTTTLITLLLIVMFYI